MKSFRDLTVWQSSMGLVEAVYRATETFPRQETFGLSSQIRRAAVSIPSNLAEGKAAGGRHYLRHVRTALGSEAELQTQLEIAKRLRYIGAGEASALIAQAAEVGRMLSALLAALRRHEQRRLPGGPTV